MPKPRANESERDFITRCMLDDEARSDFPNSNQRLAFCYSQFRNKRLVKTQKLTKDLWTEIFTQYALRIADANVVNVANTAKKTLIKVAERLFADPEFASLGVDQKTRILQSQFKNYSRFQAERLVRTESNRSANYATMQSATTIFDANDLMKTWIHNTLANEREWHKNFEPKTIPYNDPYILAGEYVQQPGDGSAKNIINCRCTIAVHPTETTMDYDTYNDDFDNQRTKAENNNIPTVQRYYQSEYNKTTQIIAETGNVPYQDIFDYGTTKQMYKTLIIEIATFFAIWYADNIENYLKNG